MSSCRCPECKQIIDAQALVCPDCGADIRSYCAHEHRIGATVAVTAVAIFAIFVFGVRAERAQQQAVVGAMLMDMRPAPPALARLVPSRRATPVADSVTAVIDDAVLRGTQTPESRDKTYTGQKSRRSAKNSGLTIVQ
jgi:hypothetical protein